MISTLHGRITASSAAFARTPWPIGFGVLLALPLFFLVSSGPSIGLSGPANDTRFIGLNLPFALLAVAAIAPLAYATSWTLGTRFRPLRAYVLVMAAYGTIVLVGNLLFFQPRPVPILLSVAGFVVPPLLLFVAERAFAGNGPAAKRVVAAMAWTTLALVGLVLVLNWRYVVLGEIHPHPSSRKVLFFYLYNWSHYWPATVLLFSTWVTYQYFGAEGRSRAFFLAASIALLVYFVGLAERTNVLGAYLMSVAAVACLMRRPRQAFVMGLAVVLTLLVLATAFQGPGSDKFVSYFVETDDAVLHHRERTDEQATLARNHTSDAATGFMLQGETGTLTADDARFGASQNQYVAALFKLGILGGAIFLAHAVLVSVLLGRLLYGAWRRRTAAWVHAVGVGLLALLVVNAQFQHVLTNAFTGPLFYFTLGAVLLAEGAEAS